MYEINRILSDDDQCVTLTATDSHKIGCLEKNGIRNLSIRECLRLFGFPEWYSLEGIKQSSAYDLIGNSIVVPVVENIVRHWMSKKP